MPTHGLSLLGLMDEALAVAFLRQSCIPRDPNPDAILQQLNEARARVGKVPTPRAGYPEIVDLPAGAEQHLATVAAHPRLAGGLDGMPFSFALVEIDPLLAFQFVVDLSRTD